MYFLPHFSTENDYSKNYRCAEIFAPHIQRLWNKLKNNLQVCHPQLQSHLIQVECPQMIPFSSGLSPVFKLCQGVIIKLFGEFASMNDAGSYETELHIYSKIISNNIQKLYFPILLAHGSIKKDLEIENDADLPWNYIIMSEIGGNAIEKWKYDKEQLTYCMQQFGKVLCQFHESSAQSKPLWVSEDIVTLSIKFFPSYLEERIAYTVEKSKKQQLDFEELPKYNIFLTNHQGFMPTRLMLQIDSYLQQFIKERVPALLADEKKITALHMDLHSEHIFVEKVQNQGNLSSKLELRGFIDLADTALAHIYMEFIPIHFWTFYCDKYLLKIFLEAYGLDTKDVNIFAYDMMCLTLLHYLNMLLNGDDEGYLFIDFSKIQSLDELAQLIWNYEKLDFNVNFVRKQPDLK